MNETLLRNANSLLGHGRQREALLYYERYLNAEPQSVEAWHNRGAALAQLKRYGEALESYDRVLALSPSSAQTWNSRGNVLFEERRYADAAEDYGRALALDPLIPYARGNWLLSKLWCCDWTDLREERAKIAAELSASARTIQPFGALMVLRNPAELMRAARIWMAGRHGAPAPLWRGEPYRHKRLRIAYLSGDFHTHPVSILMAGVFERHNRDNFEITGVSFGPEDGSDMRARLERAFEHFIDVRGQSDYEIAGLLRERETDVVVDLMGLTADCRSGILANRPVPVQVNYLGFPGTMAVPYMDYILADHIVVPVHERQYFSERVVYLPDCYMANDSERKIAAARPSRSDAGLPENGFVFASFNNAYKLTPETFDIWMRLLATVEGSVLWLGQAAEPAPSNLRREAAKCGIAPERLIFAPYLDSVDAHLARLPLADLFLDTLPCNAHTTAADALWAGLPVLTCAGSTFPGRVAASLLQAVGLPELVTHSVADYEAQALRLARDPVVLRDIRGRLAKNRDSCPLFDTAKFTRNLEAAYGEMVARRARGQTLESFAVGSGS